MFKCVDNKIQITRGDSAIFSLAITKESGEAVTLAGGDKVLFTVKRTTRDKEVLIQKDITGGFLVLLPSDTAELPYGFYVYDVQLTYADGEVDTIIPPNLFSVCEEVTF